MSTEVSYVLVGDGGSDKALLPIISWAIRRARPTAVIPAPTFVARAAKPIDGMITHVATAYEPKLIFVHRDAEKLSYEERRREIPIWDRVVPVVPVRMIEAWLLIDEPALRMAAHNPNGSVALEMPEVNRLEGLPDPKKAVYHLLRSASELNARRRRSFSAERAVHRLAELIDDFSPLFGLPAFASFWEELKLALDRLGAAG